MRQGHQMTERLIAEFTENYLEKLFYFCLKRTGGNDEAEDLASDIALNIITALDKGTIPTSFSAWIWQIARNRYSVWADTKRRYRESAAGTAPEDCEFISDDMSVEENLIRQEELSLLRRELSFISSDYRNILIAYYIEDRKVQDIAASANLSEGTVKSKLFRARKKLKEGMNMAREFGTKSFKPENVEFITSGNQPSGIPWSLLTRKLPKNILLEASNNPSTIEELSIELGTAVPYMEEEVEILVNGTLLKRVGDKYITSFFITDRDSRFAIYKAQRRFARERSEMIGTIVSDTLAQIRSLGVVRNDMSDNDLRWWAVIYLVDHCLTKSKSYTIDFPEKRANGEEWGIMGFEQAELPEYCAIGQNAVASPRTAKCTETTADPKTSKLTETTADPKISNCTETTADPKISKHTEAAADPKMPTPTESIFWFYKLEEYGLWDRDTALTPADVLFLGDVIRNSRNLASFSASETVQWHNIENRFAHADSAGNIIPDILVMYHDDLKKIKRMWNSHPLFEKVVGNIETTSDETLKILRQNANPILHDQLAYCTSMHMLDLRTITMHDEINSGRLTPPNDPEHSRAAMWLVLER
ncbi:MAG TPA: hypothetical protein DCZ91_11990 [Lachnospiraceae bacterium]|nr:hypothetical protein [Lachnospiraceae bacterium]